LALRYLRPFVVMLMISVIFWDSTWRRVVIPPGSRSPRTSWHLKLGPVGCLETSLHNYHSTLRNIPEERRSYIDIICSYFVINIFIEFLFRSLRYEGILEGGGDGGMTTHAVGNFLIKWGSI
jgi:hypothetical protein